MKYAVIIMLLIVSGCNKPPEIRPAEKKLLTHQQVVDAIQLEFTKRELTPPPAPHVYDKHYCKPKHKDIVKALEWLAYRVISDLKLEGKGYRLNVRDCDKFAYLVAAHLPFMTINDYPLGAVPVAVVSLHMPKPHAIIGWMDEEGFWLAEPQASGKAKIYKISELKAAETIYWISLL